MIQKLGEKELAKCLDAQGFDVHKHPIPRFVLCNIAENVGLDPAECFPSVAYRSPGEFWDDLNKLYLWFTVRRNRDDSVGMEVASRIADTFQGPLSPTFPLPHSSGGASKSDEKNQAAVDHVVCTALT